jgi:hypothetical protein
MEMPSACSNCAFCEQNYFYTRAYCRISDDDDMMSINEIRSKRRDNCPLVPVPPHGRCIDADALINKHFGKEFLSKVMTADEDDMGTALVNIPLVINNAPTIIPAEDGET